MSSHFKYFIHILNLKMIRSMIDLYLDTLRSGVLHKKSSLQS